MDEKGIAAFEGEAEVGYFREPDGTTSRSLKLRITDRAHGPSIQSRSGKEDSQKFVDLVHNVRVPRSVSGAGDKRVR
jgi:hypothetical protein